MNQDAAIRGERARQLLEDPLFIEAFDQLEAEVIDSLAAANLNDTGVLQHNTGMLKALRYVRQHLQSVVTTGTQADRSPQAVA